MSQGTQTGAPGEAALLTGLKKNGYQVFSLPKHPNANGPDAIAYKNGFLYLLDNKETNTPGKTIYYVQAFKNERTYRSWLKQAERDIRKANISGRIKNKAIAALKEGRIELAVTTTSTNVKTIGPGLKKGVMGRTVSFMRLGRTGITTLRCAAYIPFITQLAKPARVLGDIADIRKGKFGEQLQKRLDFIDRYFPGYSSPGAVYYYYMVSGYYPGAPYPENGAEYVCQLYQELTERMY